MISFYVNPNVLMLAYALLLFSLALVLVCLTLSLSPCVLFRFTWLIFNIFSFFFDLQSANMLFSASFPTVRLNVFLLFPSFRLDFETSRRQRRRLLQVTTERRRQRLPGSVLSNSNSIWPHSLLRFHPLQLRCLSLSSSRRRSTNCNQVPKIMLRFVRSLEGVPVSVVCAEARFRRFLFAPQTEQPLLLHRYVRTSEGTSPTYVLLFWGSYSTRLHKFRSFFLLPRFCFLPFCHPLAGSTRRRCNIAPCND